MKISAAVAALTPFLAKDAKPEAVAAALLAADKKGKDAASGELEEKDQAAKDAAEKEAERKEAEDKARDEKDDKAEDEKDDPEGTNDEDMPEVEDEAPESPEGGAKKPFGKDKHGKDKKGMDAVNAAVASALSARDALHTARREVEPVIGAVTFDTAAQVYKAALDKLGVSTDGIHASAYPALLKLAKDKAAPAVIAHDSAAVSDMTKAIKGYGRLR